MQEGISPDLIQVKGKKNKTGEFYKKAVKATEKAIKDIEKNKGGRSLASLDFEKPKASPKGKSFKQVMLETTGLEKELDRTKRKKHSPFILDNIIRYFELGKEIKAEKSKIKKRQKEIDKEDEIKRQLDQFIKEDNEKYDKEQKNKVVDSMSIFIR